MAERREPEFVTRASPPDPDRQIWTRVLVLAVLGFGVGVAWPKLTGVRFGPNAPGAEAPASGRAPDAVAAMKVEPAAPASAASAEPLPTVASSVKLGESFVLSCTGKDGEQKKGPDCGPYRALDALAEPKIRKLAACPAARNAVGHISLVASLDFAQRRLDASLGKSTSLQNADASAVLGCLREGLEGLDIASLPHDQAKVTVVYKIDLESAGTAPEAVAAPVASAAPAAPAPGGSVAEVTWEQAIVRSAPRTGEVVARLPRGTKLKLQSADSGWWKVSYGDGAEGYVYRGAIGR